MDISIYHALLFSSHSSRFSQASCCYFRFPALPPLLLHLPQQSIFQPSQFSLYINRATKMRRKNALRNLEKSAQSRKKHEARIEKSKKKKRKRRPPISPERCCIQCWMDRQHYVLQVGKVCMSVCVCACIVYNVDLHEFRPGKFIKLLLCFFNKFFVYNMRNILYVNTLYNGKETK